MIYTEKTRMAMRIAYCAHGSQLDRAEVPYIFHAAHVAEQMDTEDKTVVALLHDVLEDSRDYTPAFLREQFGDTVSDALEAITRRPGEAYGDYLARVKFNPIAKEVKIADLKHNADLTRLAHVNEKDELRAVRYAAALDYMGR